MTGSSKGAGGLLLLLIILTVCFAWGNSLIPAKQSVSASDRITQALGGEVTDKSESFQRPAYTKPEEVHDDGWYFRKFAHFFEFLLLGGEIALLIGRLSLRPLEKWLIIALCGVLIPLIDETIQLFNDRNPMVRDIWIDIAGFIAGCCILRLLCFLYHRVRGRKNKV